jgi:hypothetical protein
MNEKPFLGILIVGTLLVTGCTTPSTVAPSAPSSTNAPLAAFRRSAVVIGLNSVDPRKYSGWSGPLPDCEVDADVYALMARDAGMQDVTTLKTRQATRAAVFAAILKANDGMGPNDLLFLAHSSHGGQVADQSGDEADGLDETICLFDGQLVDDDMMRFLATLRPCRVLLISDSCHSEGNFKARPFVLRTAKSKGPKWGGAILQFAGCREAKTSQSTGSGGRWTTALVDAWQTGQTYRAWYNAAAAEMPRSQQPVMAEHGPSFADVEVLR